MSVTGIICEYDPLHTGHARLMAQARDGGASAVVCAMSGNFTQRGGFALADKCARAEMAVSCGADLVLELPTVWAMATAERFAQGGVDLLCRTGVVTELLFGSESGDLAALTRVADCLEGSAFPAALAALPEDGRPFAARRQHALASLLGPADASLLESPNNTLAVEYLRALRRLRAPLSARTVRRTGAQHGQAPSGGFASASYLRRLLAAGAWQEAAAYLPPPAAEVLRRQQAAGRLTDGALCERAILARLRTMTQADWRRLDRGGEGLGNRLYQAARTGATLAEVLAAAKTKRYPMARLRRLVLAAWLDLPEPPDRVPYLRVLAANEAGRRLLRQMRDHGAPVLTKPADAAALGPDAAALFAVESRCTDLYVLARPSADQMAPGQDWRTTPVMF